jgi:hypothetical protein
MTSAQTDVKGSDDPQWEIKPMPDPPPVTLRGIIKWCGPAVILGTLSVGGFEAYHAGYVSAQQLTGIFWLYLVSSFAQLFLNNEIARYGIATGETVMQGFYKLKPRRFWTWFTAIFVFIQQAWPAWIGGAAAGAAALMGFGTWEQWAVVALALVFILFAASPFVYKTLEYIMYACFIIANVGITIFTILMAPPQAFAKVAMDWLSFGLIPAGISVAAIGPFLNQPAGGFWNFWHTYWVRERGMGMSAYMGHVTGLAWKPEEIRRSGYIFDTNDPKELKKFSQWMKLNGWTMVLFFIILGGIWFTYVVSVAGYTAAAYYGLKVPSGWKIAVVIAEIFGKVWGPIAYSLFGIVIMASLFDSQFSVYDGIARQWADTLYLELPEQTGKRPYRFWYFVMLAIVVVWGIMAIPLGTPYAIWLAVNWLGNLAHAYVTLGVTYMNYKLLPKPIRPKWYHLLVNIVWSIVCIAYFIIWTVYQPPWAS